MRAPEEIVCHCCRVRVADVAQFVGLCRSQLYRVFMAESGLSVQDWITRAKTRRAQALLRSTQLKLSAVALSAGFASAEQLCHAFRRNGLPSPSEYRQSCQKIASERGQKGEWWKTACDV